MVIILKTKPKGLTRTHRGFHLPAPPHHAPYALAFQLVFNFFGQLFPPLTAYINMLTYFQSWVTVTQQKLQLGVFDLFLISLLVLLYQPIVYPETSGMSLKSS